MANKSFSQNQRVVTVRSFKSGGQMIRSKLKARVLAPLEPGTLRASRASKGQIAVVICDPKAGDLYGITVYGAPSNFGATHRGRPKGSVKVTEQEEVTA